MDNAATDESNTPSVSVPDSRPGTSHNSARNLYNCNKMEPLSKEDMVAKRRCHWQLIMERDLEKKFRQRQAAKKEAMDQRKLLAEMCCNHVRTKAEQLQNKIKETPLENELQMCPVRDTGRRNEEVIEMLDIELFEVTQQRRQMNLIITQTELFIHFLQRNAESDVDLILNRLEEVVDPKLAGFDFYNRESLKAKALEYVREVFHAERARMQMFDEQIAIPTDMDVDVEGDWEPIQWRESNVSSLFKRRLNDLQLKDMKWLANLYDQGMNGILPNGIGIGTTVLCIAFMCHVAQRRGAWGPFIVVTAASSMLKWVQEFERSAPDFKVMSYGGSSSERIFLRKSWSKKCFSAFHVVVTSFHIMLSDLDHLNKIKWISMVLEDPKAIIRTHSLHKKQLLGFNCRNRLLLSGPIQNNFVEQWALLHFIMPTLFEAHDTFNDLISKYIENDDAINRKAIDENLPEYLSRLRTSLKPFILCRVKQNYVNNAPAVKKRVMVHFPLSLCQTLLNIGRQNADERKRKEIERRNAMAAVRSVVPPTVSLSPVNYREPAVSLSPVNYREPAVSLSPVNYREPAVSLSPVNYREPAVSLSPVNYREPAVSLSPVNYREPAVSLSPVNYREPAVSLSPVNYREPAVSLSPVNYREPAVSLSPVNYREPAVSLSPVNYRHPTVSLSPVNYREPTVSFRPVNYWAHIPPPQPLGPNTPLLEEDDFTSSNIVVEASPELIRRQEAEERSVVAHIPPPQPLGPNTPLLEEDDFTSSYIFVEASPELIRRQEAEERSVVQPSGSNFSPMNYYQTPMTYIPPPQPFGPNTPLLEEDDFSSPNLGRDASLEHTTVYTPAVLHSPPTRSPHRDVESGAALLEPGAGSDVVVGRRERRQAARGRGSAAYTAPRAKRSPWTVQ